jgi:SAM-dependent methyltransferase
MNINEIVTRYNTNDEFEKRNLAIYRQLSGAILAKEIAKTNPSLVIDLGCGGNVFKKYIPNLMGIDITPHPNVDIIDDLHNTLNHFKEGSVDWILNFGPLQYVNPKPMVNMMYKLLKPGGTIVAHTCVRAPWCIEYVKQLGLEFNLNIIDIEISYTDTTIMNKKDLKIQRSVAKWSNFEMADFVAPRLTWRWVK